MWENHASNITEFDFSGKLKLGCKLSEMEVARFQSNVRHESSMSKYSENLVRHRALRRMSQTVSFANFNPDLKTKYLQEDNLRHKLPNLRNESL